MHRFRRIPQGHRKADLRSVSVNDLYWRGRRDLILSSGGDLALVAVFPGDVYLFDTLTDKTGVRPRTTVWPISLFVPSRPTNNDPRSILRLANPPASLDRVLLIYATGHKYIETALDI